MGHSEGDLLFLEQVALRSTTPPQLIDSMVQALADMRQLSGNTVAAPSHVVRFMGQIGIVTPYFEAIPLRLLQVAAHEKQAAFPIPVATKIALDVFDGLCQYHALDAKLCGGICPDHLFVGTDGDARVGNVAVAAMTPKESPWRGRVERLAYLAPEQVTASRGYDARTDVYALGVVVWEMVANQPRMAGSPAQILESLRNAKGPPVLSPLDESRISKGFLDALSRALHPDPAERHPSVGAFARKLLEAEEEPAEASDVAAFVEQVAQQSLQSLRTAVALQQIQTIKQNRSSKSGSLPRLENITQASAAKTPAGPRSPKVEGILPNTDHTAVFKVTAELLQKARRGPNPSEPRQRVAPLVTPDESAANERTVTFDVPEDLLEEARRLFEATEQAAPLSDFDLGSPPSSHDTRKQRTSVSEMPSDSRGPIEERTVDQQHSEALLRKLRSDVPARESQVTTSIPRYDDDVTTIWRPQRPSELLESPKTSPLYPSRTARKKPVYWLLGILICGVVGALVLIMWRVARR